MLGREHLFIPLEVEQATRAPGELRVTPRARADRIVATAKKAPAKTKAAG